MIYIEHAHLQQNLHVRVLFPLDILKASQQPQKKVFPENTLIPSQTFIGDSVCEVGVINIMVKKAGLDRE